MDAVQLKITSTVDIDGHEYVIVSMDMKAGIAGRSAVIVALDAESANREHKRAIEQDTTMSAQSSLLRMVSKAIEDSLDRGQGGRDFPFNGLGGMQ